MTLTKTAPRPVEIPHVTFEEFPLIVDINVTNFHIDKGWGGNGILCAVALAVRQRFDGATHVNVNSSYVAVRTEKGIATYIDNFYTAFDPTITPLARMIKRFDSYKLARGFIGRLLNPRPRPATISLIRESQSLKRF